MRSRLAVCVVGMWCLMASATAEAQPAPGSIPPQRIFAPAPYEAGNTWPDWGVPAYNDPGYERLSSGPQFGPGPDGIITERISGDRGGGYEDTPFDRFAIAVAKSTYIQLDYLNFDFEGPGRVQLGSNVAGVVDATRPFSATIAGLPGTARVPTTEGLRYKNSQGIRGLFGLPTSVGTFEASIFTFDNDSSRKFEAVPPALVLNPAAQIQIATSTLLNGQPSNNLFLYNASFEVATTANFYGAEANWLAKSPYEEGLVTRPLIGFRYLNFQETLFQTGVFTQINPSDVLSPSLVSLIDSGTENRVFAPQIGVRLELVNPWITLGFEPKVAFGVNNYSAFVSTERLRSPGDPRVFTEEEDTRFSPIGDFSVYGKIRVRENFSLQVGYQLIVAAGITRPANNIVYNDNGSSNPAAIVVDADHERMVWQGLTIGGELRFR